MGRGKTYLVASETFLLLKSKIKEKTILLHSLFFKLFFRNLMTGNVVSIQNETHVYDDRRTEK